MHSLMSHASRAGRDADLVVAVQASSRPGPHGKGQAEEAHDEGCGHGTRRMRGPVRGQD